MTRLLVFGGRHFWDLERVERVLDRIHVERPVSLLIEGGAPGADLLGRQWALRRGISIETYAADWSNLDAVGAVIRRLQDGTVYNARAGFTRNQRMIDIGRPDLAVAFPGGRGTSDMNGRCWRSGIRVIDG